MQKECLAKYLAPGIQEQELLGKFSSWPTFQEVTIYPHLLQAHNISQPEALLSKLELIDHGLKCIRLRGELLFQGKIHPVQVLWKQYMEDHLNIYRKLRNTGKLKFWISTEWKLWNEPVIVTEIMPSIQKDPQPHLAEWKTMALCLLDQLRDAHTLGYSYSRVALSCIAKKEPCYVLLSDIEYFSERRIKRCLEELFHILPQNEKEVSSCNNFLSSLDDYDDLRIYPHLKSIILGKPLLQENNCRLM